MSSEKEMKVIEKAAMFDLQRLLKEAGKETYTLDEIIAFINTIVDAKEQAP